MLDLSLLRNSGKFVLGVDRPRVAFIHHGFRTTQLEIIDKRRPRFSPRYASLGLLNLARSLEVDHQNGRIDLLPEMKYFDEDCYENDDDLAASVMKWLRVSRAGFVLVGLYTLAFERTASLLAKIDPTEFCIVVGGAHPTVAPDVDFAHISVRGEGGAAVQHIMNNLFKKSFGEGPAARGICCKLDGKAMASGPAFDNSLATIPPPAFAYKLSQSSTNIIDRPRERWWKAVGNSPQIYICTQSCRARCTFCSTYLIHGRLVSRPVQFVEADIDHIINDFGHDSIQFHDDDLLQHEQFDDLMKMLSTKPITWTCNARSEFMSMERAVQLYDSGCRKVFLGVESLNQQSLDYYRKKTTVEMNKAAVKHLDAAGIGVVCGYIIGAPHDTLESTLADLDSVLELPIFFLSTAILTPDVGTVEYHRAKKKIPEMAMLGDEGTHLNIQPRPDLFGSNAPYGLPTVCDSLTKNELNELYVLTNCSFFLRQSTYDRIRRLTPDERKTDVQAWYEWTYQSAENLFGSASLAPVQERALALLTDPWVKHFFQNK